MHIAPQGFGEWWDQRRDASDVKANLPLSYHDGVLPRQSLVSKDTVVFELPSEAECLAHRTDGHALIAVTAFGYHMPTRITV